MTTAKILIVEDEAIISMEVEAAIKNLGYEVTSVVNSGDIAIIKAEEDKPDLILMDIRIKGDMDGIDTAEIIRKKHHIPIVFSTAYLDKERIDRAKITMPFGYVLKPIQERDLRVTIEMALYVAKVDAERRKFVDLFKRVFEENLDPVVLYSQDRSFKILNKAWEKVLGYSLEELSNRPLVGLMHPDDKEKAIEKYHNDEKETPFEAMYIRYRHKDGDYRLLEARSSPARDGIKFSTARDITEQKQKEWELESENDLYKSLFHQAANASILVNTKSGMVYDCNYAFLNLAGIDKNKIIGTSEEELYKAINAVIQESGSPLDERCQKVKVVDRIFELRTQLIRTSDRELYRKTLVPV